LIQNEYDCGVHSGRGNRVSGNACPSEDLFRKTLYGRRQSISKLPAFILVVPELKLELIFILDRESLAVG